MKKEWRCWWYPFTSCRAPLPPLSKLCLPLRFDRQLVKSYHQSQCNRPPIFLFPLLLLLLPLLHHEQQQIHARTRSLCSVTQSSSKNQQMRESDQAVNIFHCSEAMTRQQCNNNTSVFQSISPLPTFSFHHLTCRSNVHVTKGTGRAGIVVLCCDSHHN